VLNFSVYNAIALVLFGLFLITAHFKKRNLRPTIITLVREFLPLPRWYFDLDNFWCGCEQDTDRELKVPPGMVPIGGGGRGHNAQ
jgi:hypothetical protein